MLKRKGLITDRTIELILSLPKRCPDYMSCFLCLNSVNPGDSVRIILDWLHPKTRFLKIPAAPYQDEGCHFKILLYRNI
jgi:hypothetical protein